MEILTNEWTEVRCKMPPRDREVLVSFGAGVRKVTLVWNGFYWVDPVTRIRQRYTPGHEPRRWYMFERCVDDYGERD